MKEDKKELDLEVEVELDFFQKYLGFSAKTFFFLLVFVVFLGVYIGILLYGKNSINVLLKLQSYETYLNHEIKNLKAQNADLQKEYFELKELSDQ